jgi:tripartite-type tricarboxylate transporter receptor subunit TctC
MITTTHNIDELGTLLAQIKTLTAKADAIKKDIKEEASLSGQKKFEGDDYVVTYVESNVSTVDWKAIAGPKGMPQEAVTFLNRELNLVLKHKSVSERFDSEGTTAVGGTPEDLMRTIVSDIDRWKKIIEVAQVKF